MFTAQRLTFVLLGIAAVFAWIGANPGNAAAAGPIAAPVAAPTCNAFAAFDSKNFTDSTIIDNEWLPLVPGTQFTLDGRENASGKSVNHRVIVTVTDLTKVVNGVQALVLWERDFDTGQLAESELAFEAQDEEGNVWNLGEYPEEYDNGKLTGAPKTWIAGAAGAQAGIGMPAEPSTGTHAYLQGLVTKIGFMDCGQVSQMHEKICIGAKCYEDVAVVTEWNPLEAGNAQQLKYYASGTGNIQIKAVNDPQAETLDLTSVVQLDEKGLAEARNEALKLDKRAYKVSDVYGATAPAQQMAIVKKSDEPTGTVADQQLQPADKPANLASAQTNSQSNGQPTNKLPAAAPALVPVIPFADSPTLAAPLGATIQSIPAKKVQWFSFKYDTGGYQTPRPTVTIRVLNGVSEGLALEVWSPERLQGNWRENQPIGRGTQQLLPSCDDEGGDEGIAPADVSVSVEAPTPDEGGQPTGVTAPAAAPTGSSMACGKWSTNDLTWSGGFGGDGTYYIRLINPTNAPVVPQVLIGGAGLDECANENMGLPDYGEVPARDEAFVRVQCRDVGPGLVATDAPTTADGDNGGEE